MKLATAVSLFALIAGPAMAWDTPPPAPAPTTTNMGGNGGNASQHQRQGQQQTARGGSARSSSTGGTSSASNNGSNVSVVSGGGNSGGGQGVYLSIPDGHGEAPCGGGIGLGGGGSSAGGGFGGTLWEFGECKIMRESAALDRMGYRDEAVAELCQIDRVRKAFGGKCPAKPEAHLALDTTTYPYDWCGTRNAGDASQHRECDRVVRR